MELGQLWTGLGYPLLRLIFFISLGLMVGNLISDLLLAVVDPRIRYS